MFPEPELKKMATDVANIDGRIDDLLAQAGERSRARLIGSPLWPAPRYTAGLITLDST
jgi:hypothetical protein